MNSALLRMTLLPFLFLQQVQKKVLNGTKISIFEKLEDGAPYPSLGVQGCVSPRLPVGHGAPPSKEKRVLSLPLVLSGAHYFGILYQARPTPAGFYPGNMTLI